jgi:hypothetical protein
MASDGIYDLIYMRQAEGVLRTVFVEISVIDAHLLFIIIIFLQELGWQATSGDTPL